MTNTKAKEWLDKGVVLASIKRYEDAIAYFDESLKYDPQFAIAWFHKGEALVNILRFDEAVECYRKATELDREYAQAWYGRGKALASLGRFREAVQCFDEALIADPSLDAAMEDREKAMGRVRGSVGADSIASSPGVTPITSEACPYCHTNIRISGSSFCWKCGANLETMAANSVPEPRAEDGGTGEKCMICNLTLKGNEVVLRCPHCGSGAHRVHFLEWLHVKGVCPVCGSHIDGEKLAG